MPNTVSASATTILSSSPVPLFSIDDHIQPTVVSVLPGSGNIHGPLPNGIPASVPYAISVTGMAAAANGINGQVILAIANAAVPADNAVRPEDDEAGFGTLAEGDSDDEGEGALSSGKGGTGQETRQSIALAAISSACRDSVVGVDALWYPPETIEPLSQAVALRELLPYVFIDMDQDSKKSFTKQFRALMKFNQALNMGTAYKGVCFIAKQPGAGQNHFIFGLLMGSTLLVIDPIGKSRHRDFADILSVMSDEHGLTVYCSHTVIQQEALTPSQAGLVHCGPICVELLRSISQRPVAEVMNAIHNTKRNLSGSNCLECDITTILPISLQKAANGDGYEAQIQAIREGHKKLLSSDPASYARNAKIQTLLASASMLDDGGPDDKTQLKLKIDALLGLLANIDGKKTAEVPTLAKKPTTTHSQSTATQVSSGLAKQLRAANAAGNDDSLASHGSDSGYLYSVRDIFTLLTDIRRRSFTGSFVAESVSGEAFSAHRENNKRVFIADPYHIANFASSLTDDVNRMVGVYRNGARIALPEIFILPIVDGIHWRVVRIQLDYTARMANVLWDDPYGGERFREGIRAKFRWAIVKNTITLFSAINRQASRVVNIGEAEKSIDQQGRGKNGVDCGPIVLSNIRDYANPAVSNATFANSSDGAVYTVNPYGAATHTAIVVNLRATDRENYVRISGERPVSAAELAQIRVVEKALKDAQEKKLNRLAAGTTKGQIITSISVLPDDDASRVLEFIDKTRQITGENAEQAEYTQAELEAAYRFVASTRGKKADPQVSSPAQSTTDLLTVLLQYQPRPDLSSKDTKDEVIKALAAIFPTQPSIVLENIRDELVAVDYRWEQLAAKIEALKTRPTGTSGAERLQNEQSRDTTTSPFPLLYAALSPADKLLFTHGDGYPRSPAASAALLKSYLNSKLKNDTVAVNIVSDRYQIRLRDTIPLDEARSYFDEIKKIVSPFTPSINNDEMLIVLSREQMAVFLACKLKVVEIAATGLASWKRIVDKIRRLQSEISEARMQGADTTEIDQAVALVLLELVAHNAIYGRYEAWAQGRNTLFNMMALTALLSDKAETEKAPVGFKERYVDADERSVWRDLDFLRNMLTPEILKPHEQITAPISTRAIRRILTHDIPKMASTLISELDASLSEQKKAEHRAAYTSVAFPYIYAQANYFREQEALRKILAYTDPALLTCIDPQTQTGKLALFRILEIIGEYASKKNLTGATRGLDPEIDWDLLVKIRNGLAHREWYLATPGKFEEIAGYDISQILREDVPLLRNRIKNALYHPPFQAFKLREGAFEGAVMAHYTPPQQSTVAWWQPINQAPILNYLNWLVQEKFINAQQAMVISNQVKQGGYAALLDTLQQNIGERLFSQEHLVKLKSDGDAELAKTDKIQTEFAQIKGELTKGINIQKAQQEIGKFVQKLRQANTINDAQRAELLKQLPAANTVADLTAYMQECTKNMGIIDKLRIDIVNTRKKISATSNHKRKDEEIKNLYKLMGDQRMIPADVTVRSDKAIADVVARIKSGTITKEQGSSEISAIKLAVITDQVQVLGLDKITKDNISVSESYHQVMYTLAPPVTLAAGLQKQITDYCTYLVSERVITATAQEKIIELLRAQTTAAIVATLEEAIGREKLSPQYKEHLKGAELRNIEEMKKRFSEIQQIIESAKQGHNKAVAKRQEEAEARKKAYLQNLRLFRGILPDSSVYSPMHTDPRGSGQYAVLQQTLATINLLQAVFSELNSPDFDNLALGFAEEYQIVGIPITVAAPIIADVNAIAAYRNAMTILQKHEQTSDIIIPVREHVITDWNTRCLGERVLGKFNPELVQTYPQHRDRIIADTINYALLVDLSTKLRNNRVLSMAVTYAVSSVFSCLPFLVNPGLLSGLPAIFLRELKAYRNIVKHGNKRMDVFAGNRQEQFLVRYTSIAIKDLKPRLVKEIEAREKLAADQ